ncbi:hypothetical protein ACWGKQ_15885 [Streptomyces sp. NPDC054770]
MLLASAAMYRIAVRRFLRTGQVWLSLGAIPLVVLGLHGGFLWLLLAAFAAGLGEGVMGIGWETSLQENVPTAMLSRIAAYDDLVSFVAVPVGQIAVGPLAMAFGDTRVAVVGGIVFGVTSLLPLLSASVRQLEQPQKPQTADV